jgi:hypothetical protein
MKITIKTLTLTLIMLLTISLSIDLTLAAPKGNKGKGNGNHGQGIGKGNGNAGEKAAVNNSRKHTNEKAAVNNSRKHTNEKAAVNNSRKQANEIRVKQANVRANRPTKEGRLKGDGHSGVKGEKLNKLSGKSRGRERGHVKVKDNRGMGKDFFAALGKARWSFNPHDERGQGNMGKPRMRDPYGHDKDSGREKSERGRPIKEGKPASEDPTQLSLDGLINIDFSSLGEYQSDSILRTFQNLAEYYEANWDSFYISNYYTYEQWHDILYKHFFPDSNATGLLVNHRDSIDYNLYLDNWSGGSLIVSTTLISAQDYDSLLNNYDYDTGTWSRDPISYNAGDVIFEQSQEVTFDSENSLLDYSQDLPGDIMGTEQNSAFYVELSVTVTDPGTGATYTQTYDNALYLYRCPYGKVTDKKTGLPIAGAKITVHFEDGSIVPLDRASNPTASNPQYTDATGRYGAKLRTNKKYYITAEAEGYEPYRSETFTEKWHVLREDVALTPVTDKLIMGANKKEKSQ